MSTHFFSKMRPFAVRLPKSTEMRAKLHLRRAFEGARKAVRRFAPCGRRIKSNLPQSLGGRNIENSSPTERISPKNSTSFKMRTKIHSNSNPPRPAAIDGCNGKFYSKEARARIWKGIANPLETFADLSLKVVLPVKHFIRFCERFHANINSL